MRTLILVRHAKSSWSDPLLDDFLRPLNERGRRDAPLMAERLAKSLNEPVALVSSPALRAITTAQIFAEALGLSAEDIRQERGIYESGADRLLLLLQRFDDEQNSVVMFGHNPGFSELCHQLAPCDFDEMPTCAVARLDFSVDRWRDVAPGSGRLVAYSYPKERQ